MAAIRFPKALEDVGDVLYAAIGADPVVAAVAGKRIVVLQYALTVSSATTVQWFSAANALSSQMNLATATPLVEFCPYGLFATLTGEALNLTAVGRAGHLTYALVAP